MFTQSSSVALVPVILYLCQSAYVTLCYDITVNYLFKVLTSTLFETNS